MNVTLSGDNQVHTVGWFWQEKYTALTEIVNSASKLCSDKMHKYFLNRVMQSCYSEDMDHFVSVSDEYHPSGVPVQQAVQVNIKAEK